ncbi:MAG: efflux RND transporter periplasmic adaptor subunit [Calditrichaeota bacterium]|nr:MAG: efflux RND transporter periplasmic adaptor subunit [Calditrichota bacterium]
MKKKLIIGGILVLLAIVVAANIMRKPKGTVVQTETVSRGTVLEKVTGSGRIRPAREVNISANVSAKILEIHVKEGDRVRKGQLLVKLDSEQYRAALRRAESALLGARANEKKAAAAWERTQKLYEKGMISAEAYETAQANWMAARASREQSEASRDEARDQLNKTLLYATMDGIVTKLNKETGEMAIGATFQEDVIMVVSDLSVMEAVIEVDENDIVRVAAGDSADVELDAFPDTLFRGYVSEISNTAVTRGLGTQEEITNFEVTITIQDADKMFRPGMSATVDVYTRRVDDVPRVPIQAVTVRERKRLKKKTGVEESAIAEKKESGRTDKTPMQEVVFVVEEGIARARPVTLGISDDNFYEIISGVKEGDEIITGPFKTLSKLLKDGDRVRVEKEAAHAD